MPEVRWRPILENSPSLEKRVEIAVSASFLGRRKGGEMGLTDDIRGGFYLH